MKRAVYLVLLAAIGVVTTFAQLDRQSRKDPADARLVPVALRSFAQAQLAYQSIEDKDYVKAVKRSRRLVRIRPLPAENLSLLARSELLAGDETNALPVLAVAAKRGWRDPFVQYGVASFALRNGNYLVAAQRTAALVATGLGGDWTTVLLKRLLSTPQGQTALVQTIDDGGPWVNNLEGDIRTNGSRKAAASVIGRAVKPHRDLF